MKRPTNFIPICAAMVMLVFGCGAADTPRIGPAVSAIGPLVDVTLKSGETNKGQLVSYADGNLSLRLDNGTVVTRDGQLVASVKFIAPETPAPVPVKTGIPSAQETELTLTEMEKFSANRWRENPPRGALAPKQPAPPLS